MNPLVKKKDLVGALCASGFVGLFESNLITALKCFCIYLGVVLWLNIFSAIVLYFKQSFR